MGRGLPLTDIERGRIQGQRRTASQVQRSEGAVHRVPFIPQKLHKKPGPATSLSDRELRLLVRTAAKGQLSAKKRQLELKLSTSVRTIQRVLAGVDWLVYSKMDNTLPLSTEDKRTREGSPWDMVLNKDPVRSWETIIFSDEKKWNLDGADGSKLLARHTPPTKANEAASSGRWVGDGVGGL
ncbi:unnamed protein product [Phytophthora lilii]|uniref:Unnamed protein product n=1 Tax=Phytophthora lilii TaxID=2077276 RepID=A0A9W6XGZ1_9STRA|nr:unnamed protein product [Phytophthora lilii]